jgi:hypothetical protein
MGLLAEIGQKTAIAAGQDYQLPNSNKSPFTQLTVLK